MPKDPDWLDLVDNSPFNCKNVKITEYCIP